MDDPRRRGTDTGAAGSDLGFWISLALLLGGALLVARSRPAIEAAARHPRAALAAATLFADDLRDEVAHLLPLALGALVPLVVIVVLYRRWQAGPVPVPRTRLGGRSPLRLGRLRGSRATYAVPRDATFDHLLILGRTRAGKSQHAVSLALQDLDRADCALVLIDPHDELCRSFVAAGHPALQSRPVAWLTFGNDALVPGFDLLRRGPGDTPSQVAERLVDLVDWLFFAGASTDHERLSNNLRLAAWACASAGRPLLDCRPFLTDARFRAELAAHLTDEYLLRAIQEFGDVLRRDPTFAQSAVNRLANLTDNEALRRVVGQPTTFDLGALLDGKGVLLVSLDETTLGEKGVYLLAGMLLHRIAQHLKRRAKDDAHHRNVKVRILLDEAQRYQVGLLQGMVGELAGRGAALGLITQGLTQFADPRMRAFLLNNVATYSVFTVADQEAEILAKELFATRANRVGLADERGRPLHVLSVPEQLAEHKHLLASQERRSFVALARGRPVGLCASFEVRPAVDPGVVEAFRRRCAARSGRPRAEVDRLLRDHLRALRLPATTAGPADASPTTTLEGSDSPKTAPPPGATAKAKKARTHRKDPGPKQQRLEGIDHGR